MTTLRVTEIFDSLQGEGYWTGVPMTFVRLAGCNAPGLDLGCVRWCDTPESWDPAGGDEMGVEQVIRRVHMPRLCLTGGEPLLQVDGMTELVTLAHEIGIRAHVETNGTLDPGDSIGFDWAVISPKPPDYLVAPGWDGMIDELKLVADDDLGAVTAERLAARYPGAVVCIQPEWGGSMGGRPGKEAVERALALVMDHPEWRLSLQTHKYLGIR
jgi:7-carboxy-7-deazaguanine synthase